MSVTVRTWSESELAAASSGSDPWLTTLLLNGHTFSAAEIKAYPYNLRKVYALNLEGQGDAIRIYAPSDDMALRFANTEYRLDSCYWSLSEIITTARDVAAG